MSLADGIREGSYVTVEGDARVWWVRSITIEPGGHRQVAWLERPHHAEAWNRGGHLQRVDRLRLVPPDLEDFPCSGV